MLVRPPFHLPSVAKSPVRGHEPSIVLYLRSVNEFDVRDSHNSKRCTITFDVSIGLISEHGAPTGDNSWIIGEYALEDCA